MSISSIASFSPPIQFPTSYTSSYPKTHPIVKPSISIGPKTNFLLSTLKASAADNGAGTSSSAPTAAEPVEQATSEPSSPPLEKVESSVGTKGSAAAVAEEVKVQIGNFQDPRWVGGTWDLKQFQKNGKTDWDAVIDAGEVLKFF